MSEWLASELRTLTRLRDGFLSGTAGASDYWRSEEEVALYDRTFAQRIGWKWEAVLGELSLRGWKPAVEALWDWGCGSGIAARTVLSHWPELFRSASLSDRSALALTYASARLREQAPALALRVGGNESASAEGTLLLVSHVLTELSPEALGRLRMLAASANSLIWVESATHANSRRLVEEIREPLLATGQWRVVAPCTHAGTCPLLDAAQARHWCHHFARVPSEAHQNAAWRELSKRLGLDLRVLPYSFLAMERNQPAQAQVASGFSRVLGEARELKGHLKVLSCGADGLAEKVLQKRDAPALFKRVRAAEALPLYAWEEREGRIVGEHGSGEGHGQSAPETGTTPDP